MSVHGRSAVLGALGALVMLVGGATPAMAAPEASVVVSQVYGGGGNSGATYTHDFVELFNRGSAAVDLNDWSVQYASSSGSGWQRTNLPDVTLEPGRYYLVREAQGAGGTTPLPAPDATGTIAMSASAGKVALVFDQTTLSGTCPATGIVDFVGYGTAANCFEGAGPTATLSNTAAALREDGGCADTDDNGADFTRAAPTPRNTQSPPSPCNVPKGTGSADPDTVRAGGSTLLTVAVTPASNPPSTGIAVTADLSSIGGSATQQLFDDGTHGDVTPADGTFSYLATVAPGTGVGAKSLPVTIADAEGRTGSAAISLVVLDACGDPSTPIHDIQGTGEASPVVGSTVTIEGVVVRSYQGPGEFGGFYVQEPDPDGDPATSEGMFVFSSLEPVSAGDVVRVHGRVAEFATGSSSLTELTSVGSILECSSGASVPATEITLPVDSMSDFERYEGMRVRFPQTLTATETFTLGRFGEVRLAAGGRLHQPTAVTTPGAAALAQQDLNDRRSFVLDDGNNQQNIDPTRYPLGGLTASNTLRSGYTVDGLTGVFDDRFSSYRVQPVGLVDFAASNPRTEAPEDVGGNLKVASFNVLNLFNGNGTHQEGAAGGFPTPRGADDLFEFDRQLAKEVSALTAIDADVVGLMEIENDPPPNSAIENLVAALNDAMGAGTYAFIDTGVIGSDEIKVALIYKPAKVTPVGPYKLLTSAVDPRFNDDRSRPALAQTFELGSNLERLTVVVNHLKSKGSACDDLGDPDTGDGQGNCNLTRTSAARAEVDWLASDPTGSGSPDVLVIGDLNSYTFEDPVTAFTDDGYENLTRRFGGLGAYSYVFDGQSGYLDHALASPSLASKATGATDWHINADEPTVLDYNVEFKSQAQVDYFYDPGPYRASDHDPVVVGLGLHPTFARVCELTRSYVERAGIATSLCAKLDEAEQAAADGDAEAKAEALRAYVNELKAQSGKAIAAERAAFLIRLASEL
jgi:uncharacterized protein